MKPLGDETRRFLDDGVGLVGWLVRSGPRAMFGGWGLVSCCWRWDYIFLLCVCVDVVVWLGWGEG